MNFIYIILFSVFSVSDMKPVTDKKSVLLKLPKEITNGTSISLTGEITNSDILSIVLSGEKTDEKCQIIFNPSLQSIKVISKTESNTKYNPDNNKDFISFSLKITARTIVEQNEYNLLYLEFESNEGGPHPLPECEFKSFHLIENIYIEGIQHLRSLLFVFDKVV